MSFPSKKNKLKSDCKTLSQPDLVELLQLSQKNYTDGKYIKQSELKKQVKSWEKVKKIGGSEFYSLDD